MHEFSRFHDRHEAGQLLARQLTPYKGREDVIVFALPRGGVPVGYEIARELSVPLDLFPVRKLGVPWHPELAMGAIAPGGIEILNRDVVTGYNIPPHVIRAVAEREAEQLKRQLLQYRGDRPFPNVTSKTVILVDDGLATGSTMKAAVKAVRQKQPGSVVVAVPVAASGTCRDLRREVDDIICLHTPQDFSAVGLWYDDFSQTTDEEVRHLLGQAATSERRLMKRREIARKEWPDFFESFNGQHEGWLVGVDRFEEFLDESVETCHRDGALRGVQLESGDGAIALAVDDKQTGHLVTEMIRAAHRIVLEQTEEDVDAGLEIDGPQSRLILRFRPPMPSRAVNGGAS